MCDDSSWGVVREEGKLAERVGNIPAGRVEEKALEEVLNALETW